MKIRSIVLASPSLVGQSPTFLILVFEKQGSRILHTKLYSLNLRSDILSSNYEWCIPGLLASSFSNEGMWHLPRSSPIFTTFLLNDNTWPWGLPKWKRKLNSKKNKYFVACHSSLFTVYAKKYYSQEDKVVLQGLNMENIHISCYINLTELLQCVQW